MPRRHATKAKPRWTDRQVQEALELLKTTSQRKVSQILKIPKSTLNDWWNNQHNPNAVRGRGLNTVLGSVVEDLLVEALTYTAECGYPYSRDQLKSLVQGYVRLAGKSTPFRDDRPGRDWCFKFEERHNDVLARRRREGLSLKRAAGLSKDNVAGFFAKYKIVLDKYHMGDKPWNIYNVDETGLQAERASQRVYVGKEVKNAYSLQPSSTKTMYTVLFCVNAIGQFLPPYTIYRAKSLWNTWTKGGAEGAAYGVSSSGWMFDKNFESWFIREFVTKTADRAGNHQRVLLYDGHASHLTYPTIRNAIDNKISIFCLPPNTSHALQPLDVGVFKSLKNTYSELVIKWFYDSRQMCIGKEAFAVLLKKVCEILFSKPELGVNGFRKTGLAPFNAHAVDDKIISLTGKGRSKSSGGPGRKPAQKGPRDPVKCIQKAIRENCCPEDSPMVQEVRALKTMKRRRVVHADGDCVTDPEPAERIRLDDEDRAAKAAAKTSKAAATAKNPPAKKAKAGCSTGVTIAMKPPTAKATNSAKASTSGTLDSFVIRKPSVTPSDQDAGTSKACGTLVQKGMKDFFNKAVGKKRQQKGARPYKDTSTESELSDCDPDDPAPAGVATLPSGTDLLKKLEANVSHIIYQKEGSHFPGMVTKVMKKTILVLTMAKSGIKSWSWPENSVPKSVKLSDVTDLIPPPELANLRGDYFVSKIAQYW